MRIGIPAEIKNLEGRVALTPPAVKELTSRGHEVWIEKGAGEKAAFLDESFAAADARIVDDVSEIWGKCELVVKVKEPLAVERKKLREGQVLFTYLHLAPDPEQARDLLRSGATCIAYETVTSEAGTLPLLMPMSEVAGRMATQVGAHCLESAQGGRGMLIGGVPGVLPGRVVILGGGTSGTNAAMMAVGMGADVVIVDSSVETLRRLVARFGTSIKAIFSTQESIEELVSDADLVIGTVLVPGASTPKLLTRSMIRRMKKGSVLVDVAIDQGGCAETSRPTTHSEPIYIVDGVVHYCVANMPGGVASTATAALSNATLPFVAAIADKGWRAALSTDPHLRNGLNVHAGKITHGAVAAALGYDLFPADGAATG